ncbi:tetratricopeptide repeat protein [Chthonobacter rhizosphaerae]|uniref:tetratricopeptide repeat protein n=1 Tax=Chthonobacter rhizosphaerae TaxID=2735553 RepID=UPI0015EE8D57|nr:tetratricopeptide repeat protein [Chthonobacter rhizosphaerae]
MADIFDEVGEDLRREQMKKIWQRYGVVIIAIAVLIVVGVAGWRIWEHYAATRAAEAGSAYMTALKDAEADPAAAAERLLAFASDAPDGYRVLARFRAASEKAKAGEVPGAIEAFQALADAAAVPTDLRDLARIRAAMLALDVEDLAAVKARLEPLAAPTNSWRNAAGELIALAAIKAGDWAEARTRVEAVLADPALSQDIRSRAEILRAIIDAEKGPAETKAPETAS